ncbi:glycosyltransferase [Streptomyces phage Zuko]|uniref:Glycosyltransferase n=1 Tax=Streptomyces phage Zuko TaxID=2601695 RepID=A0A5J6D7D2_9CAUD|nr:glycosyltransferase [Streptomyces phage Zuko]QEQ93583.1 glycosyltransferase [Streptomyces phage Zuko]
MSEATTQPLRIWGWAADSSGCQAYRIRFPFMAMKEMDPTLVLGIGTTIRPEAKELADVIIGQRVCMKGPSSLWVRWAKEGQKKLVYELDDDLWNIDPSNERAYYYFNDRDLQRRLLENIKLAHVVTVSTPELAEMVWEKTRHPNIHVIPNAVPAWLTDHEPGQNHHVGWGGSPTHHGDFGLLRQGMKKFLQHNPDKTFHTIGMDYAEWMKLPKGQCVHTPWVPTPEDFFRTIDYLVGVAPLADTVFNRSKSDIKFLELAALGIPTLASDVAPYRSIKDGDTGVLIKNDHEWGRTLKATVDEPETFHEMGERARQYVVENRTTTHTAPMWYNAITS